MRSWSMMAGQAAAVAAVLALSGCRSTKSRVVDSLRDTSAAVTQVEADAQAAESALRGALPSLQADQRPEAGPVAFAAGKLAGIAAAASTARAALHQTQRDVEEGLQDKPRPLWLRALVWGGIPLAGILLVVLAVAVGVPLLAQLGVPGFVSAAAWLSRRGLGIGARVADQVRLLVDAHQDADQIETTHTTRLDRIMTATRADRLAHAIWRQELRNREVQAALGRKATG